MSRQIVARRPSRSPANTALNDLALVTVDLAEVHRELLLARGALLGFLHEAVECKVPLDDVAGFVKPVEESLAELASKVDDAFNRTRAAGVRLHAIVCRS